MATLLANSFDGGTSGSTITTAGSGGISGNAFDAISGSPIWSNAQSMHGGLSMAFPAAAGAVEWTTSLTSSSTLYGRAYVFFTATPIANCTISRAFTPTSTTVQQSIVRINTTTPKVAIQAIAGTVVTSTLTLSANTWYRLEFKYSMVASGTCTTDCTIYVGDSVTATETMTQATGTGATTDSTVNAHWVGPTNGQTASTVFVDDIQVNNAGFPGPAFPQRRTVIMPRGAVQRAASW